MRKTYARIIATDLNNNPIEEVTGYVTGGSINIDGTSTVRRTCQLSLVASNKAEILTDELWCYNRLFKLEIGIGDNQWYEQGIYVITNFSKNETPSSLIISVSGQDKMCRLNGTVSGSLPCPVDFGTIEEKAADGTVDIVKVPIYTIIQNAVKEYAQERTENIIINDLDKYGYELWDYMSQEPMYMFVNENGQVEQMTFDKKNVLVKNFAGQYYSFNTLDKTINAEATPLTEGSSKYLAKIEYGETAGYHRTLLVYNGDLVLSAGDALTTMLDKLVAMLGEYEYFYDVKGRFVFQKKKTYTQELFSPINGDIITPTNYASQYSYEFKDKTLFTNYSVTPQITDVKNDFTVWGTRSSADGKDVPVHARYALCKKPKRYVSPWQNRTYEVSNFDWRELIYQMAEDHLAHQTEVDYFVKIEQANPEFLGGKTGYEPFYTDLDGFWRQLYDPEPAAEKIEEYYHDEENGFYWNKLYHLNPNSFDFWFDFLDVSGELSNYNIDKIGLRSKVINDTAVKSIYYKETPEVLFLIVPKEKNEVDENFLTSCLQIQDNVSQLFFKSAQGISAIEKVNNLINQYTCAAEALSLTIIPIYDLQVNTRIKVLDQDYILSRISFSLGNGSTMSLTGNRVGRYIN